MKQRSMSIKNIIESYVAKIPLFDFSPSAGAGDGNLATRLSEVYAALEAMEADKAPAKAAMILNGLGFSPEGKTILKNHKTA